MRLKPCLPLTGADIPDIPDIHSAMNAGIHWLRKQINRDGYWARSLVSKRYLWHRLRYNSTHQGWPEKCPRSPAWCRMARTHPKTRMADGERICLGIPLKAQWDQTAWSTYALLLANPEKSGAEQGVAFLLKHQREDGSWPEQ